MRLPTVEGAAPAPHIAIIMDGNGRWAKRRQLPRLDGHKQGRGLGARVVRAARDRHLGADAVRLLGAKLGRPLEEVRALMELLRDYLVVSARKFSRQPYSLMTIGDESAAAGVVRQPLDRAQGGLGGQPRHDPVPGGCRTAGAKPFSTPAAAWSTSARAAACRKQDITLQSFSGALSTQGLPELDLVIRTPASSGCRFLLWGSGLRRALLFTDTLWPDFGRVELNSAIACSSRESVASV